MSKLSEITKQKEELERAKKELENKAKNIDPNEIKKQYLDYYCDYFNKKDSKDIELLKRIPRYSIFGDNRGFFGTSHPLYEFCTYDIETLAILIKKLYEVHREGVYDTCVFGHCNEEMEYDYGSRWNVSRPELYFLIGRENLIKDYTDINGKFVDEDLSRTIPSRFFRHQDLVVLQASRYYQFLVIEKQDKLELTQHVEYKNKHALRNEWPYHSANFNRLYRTIKNADPQNYSYGNKKDYGMNFQISMKDAFVRDMLYSLSLYRKNNDLSEELTDIEISYLFNTLYDTNIDITAEKETTLPKKLIYAEKR